MRRPARSCCALRLRSALGKHKRGPRKVDRLFGERRNRPKSEALICRADQSELIRANSDAHGMELRFFAACVLPLGSMPYTRANTALLFTPPITRRRKRGSQRIRKGEFRRARQELPCPAPAFCPQIAPGAPSCHPERSEAKSKDLALTGTQKALNASKITVFFHAADCANAKIRRKRK